MTPEEKRERRRLRHELQARVARYHFRHWKLYATAGALRRATKQVTEQILAGKDPTSVEKLK